MIDAHTIVQARLDREAARAGDAAEMAARRKCLSLARARRWPGVIISGPGGREIMLSCRRGKAAWRNFIVTATPRRIALAALWLEAGA